MNPTSKTVIGEPGVDAASQELIATPLAAGKHFFFTADYAGIPTNYTLSRVQQCSCVYERKCKKHERCIDDISVAEVMSAIHRRAGARG